MNEQELRQALGTLEVYKAQLEAVAEQQTRENQQILGPLARTQ